MCNNDFKIVTEFHGVQCVDIPQPTFGKFCTSPVKSFRISVMVTAVKNSFNCKLKFLINISSLLFVDLLMKNDNLQQFFAFCRVSVNTQF